MNFFHTESPQATVFFLSLLRMKLHAEEEERLRVEQEKKDKFEALPKWKQDLLLKKSSQKTSEVTIT